MPLENWDKIKEIFLEAVDLAPAERAQYLAENCREENLRAEVEKLLRQDAEAENLLSRPALEKTAGQLFAESLEQSDPLIGEKLGAYRLTGEIGRGGMGTVYAAERADDMFRRRVAVKLIKRGMETEFLLRRFRTERQVLAALNHPNIARLFDGGTTRDGLPYFVMEYVDGRPLYEFCDERKLDLKRRLEIFLQVCEAVDAAHRIRVVHRDLKPSNILVRADGTPKLLDFGIAKLLDAELADATIESTATHLRMMTPEYASPEQITGDAITPASDVYSLGVILYELLSGHRPYRFKNRSPLEIARVVCEKPPPSLRRSLDKDEMILERAESTTLDRIFEARGASPTELRAALSGDLENIVMRALAKRAEDRYPTAFELAADIRLFLAGKPIKKHFPASPGDPVSSKKVKLSLAVLPLRVIISPIGAQADQQYLSIGLADSLITRLSRIGRFVVCPTSSILRFADAEDAFQAGADLGVDFVIDGNIRFAGNRIRVTTQLLDVNEHATQWAESFDEEYRDVLKLEDSISEKVTNALVPQLTSTEKQILARRETNDPRAFEAYLRGRFYWNQFSPEAFQKAFESFQQAVELDASYALAYVGLADFYIWANIYGLMPSKPALTEAEKYAREAARLDETLGEALATLSFVLQSRRRWTEAETLKRRAIGLAPNYHHVHEWYADQLIALGRTEEGIRESLTAERLAPHSLRAKTMVAFAFYQARRYEEALRRGREIIELDKSFPSGHSVTGLILWATKRYAEALPYLARFNEMIPDSAYAKYQFCFGLAGAGKLAEARKVLAEIKTLARDGYVKPHFLGLAHVAVGEFDRAFEYFEESFADDDPWMLWFGVEPMLEPIRNDARYIRLLRRLRNPLAEKYAARRKESEKTIAVLPLKLFGTPPGAGSEDEYLGVGLADAMISRLSNVQRLMVRPTSSILSFAEATDAFEAGRELRADFVLTGTMRRAGGRVRISAQLLDVKSRTSIWAENFNEYFTDVLELEDTVAEKVASLLIPKLTGDERQKLAKRRTDSPEAFEAYLHGRYHLFQGTPSELAKAKTYFEAAIRIDPAYALAYAGLSEYYFILGAFAPVSPVECYLKSSEMAQQALALDDSLGEAYATLGFLAICNFEFERAERILERSVELSPNYSLAAMWRSILFSYFGRSDEAIAESRRAVELNPLSGFEKSHHAFILYQARRFDEAVEAGRRAVADDPNFSHGSGTVSWIFRSMGLTGEALELARRAVETSGGNPWLVCNLAACLAKAGETAKARELLRELESSSDIFVLPCRMAIAYLNVGDADRTFAELEKAYAIKDPMLVWISSEPEIDALRGDRRFIDLEQRVRQARFSKTDGR